VQDRLAGEDLVDQHRLKQPALRRHCGDLLLAVIKADGGSILDQHPTAFVSCRQEPND
jgi:hypothetical protein